MAIELTRLGFGLLLLVFHGPIADFMLERERALVVLFRERGVPVPAAPTTETARNIYFCLATFVVLWQAAKIWLVISH